MNLNVNKFLSTTTKKTHAPRDRRRNFLEIIKLRKLDDLLRETKYMLSKIIYTKKVHVWWNLSQTSFPPLFYALNRLDAKSSRGMIYENEELRIRTININAEVEKGLIPLWQSVYRKSIENFINFLE